MTDSQLPAFMQAFHGLARVFPLRGDQDEIGDMAGSYFKALRRFDLALVVAGADRCAEQLKRFPKPAEWRELIPRRNAAPEIPALSPDDSREYRRAERLGYEDTPCTCRACRASNASGKPLRFVPDVDRDGNERKVRDGDRVVVAGVWLHGAELARWYEAKGGYYEAFYRWINGAAMPATTGFR